MEQRQRFSIRKFKTTVGSALLISVLIGSPLMNTWIVLAQEQTSSRLVKVDTKMTWGQDKTFTLPTDRTITESLAITTQLSSSEVIDLEATKEANKSLGWEVSTKEQSILYTPSEQLLKPLNQQLYRSEIGQAQVDFVVAAKTGIKKETVKKEIEVSKTRTVEKTRQVSKTVTETIEEPYTETVKKTRKIPKTETETVIDYTKSPLNLAYILDTSSSRQSLLPTSKKGVTDFVSSLDKSLISFYGESYSLPVDSTYSANHAWTPEQNSFSTPEGDSTYVLASDRSQNLKRINQLAAAFPNKEAETVVVFESDFDDYNSEASDKSQTAYTFTDPERIDQLADGVKLLLIDDSNVSELFNAKAAPTELTEVLPGKVWMVASRDENGNLFNRNEILDRFMKEVAKHRTVTKTTMVDEEYEDTITGTRPKTVSKVIQVPEVFSVEEPYTDKETITEEVEVPYATYDPLVIRIKTTEATVTKVRLTRDGQELQELELIDGQAQYLPTEEGNYQLSFDYELKEEATAKIEAQLVSIDGQTGLEKELATRSISQEGKGSYQEVKFPLPVLVSTLKAYDTLYKRELTLDFNKGKPGAKIETISLGQEQTEKESVAVTKTEPLPKVTEVKIEQKLPDKTATVGLTKKEAEKKPTAITVAARPEKPKEEKVEQKEDPVTEVSKVQEAPIRQTDTSQKQLPKTGSGSSMVWVFSGLVSVFTALGLVGKRRH